MSQEHALEGTSVGIYEVRTRIGRGGMGEVYLARDTRLGRPVKVLPERFALDERFRGRLPLALDREAQRPAASTADLPDGSTEQDSAPCACERRRRFGTVRPQV